MPNSISNEKSGTHSSEVSTYKSSTKSVIPWTKESIKSLRQRLGWSQAELSRKLNCASSEVLLWESGQSAPSAKMSSELLLLSKQAEACSQEVQTAPLAENICDKKALGQIEFSDIKEEIE